MEPILASLEILNNGNGIQVDFEQAGSVISHSIFLIHGDSKTPVLTSQFYELTHPNFTELHQQGETLFLTGANGPCHWSMSVQKRELNFAGVASATEETLNLLEKRFGIIASGDLIADPHSFDQVLFFDIACRLKGPFPNIGSPYITLDGFEGTEAICACCVMDCSDTTLGMVLLGGPTEGIQSLSGPNYLMEATGREICFSPSITAETFPATLRWSYSVWRVM